MHRRRGIGGIEERFAQAVGRAGTGEALVQEHGTIGNRLVELGQRRMTMFGPLVGMPAAHGGNPCALRNILAARGQCFLDFPNRSGVLQNRVVAGTIRQADDVDVRFDQPGHDGAAAEVDDANAGSGGWRGVDSHKPAVSNGHGCGDGVGVIQGVDPAVGEHENFFRRDVLARKNNGSGSGCQSCRSGGGAQELPAGSFVFHRSDYSAEIRRMCGRAKGSDSASPTVSME